MHGARYVISGADAGPLKANASEHGPAQAAVGGAARAWAPLLQGLAALWATLDVPVHKLAPAGLRMGLRKPGLQWASRFLAALALVGVALLIALTITRVFAPVLAWALGHLGGPSLEHIRANQTQVAALLLALAMAVCALLLLALLLGRTIARAQRMQAENQHLVAQLRSQVALVEEANAEKSRFLGAASHDLRQPMHALGLFAAALEQALRGTAHYPKVLSMARAVDALEASFGVMLDISRLDAGIVQPKLRAFPIRDVYRQLHMHCAGQAEERGLALRFKPGGKIVTSDPLLLERILSNLIHNAIRHTDAGGIVVVTRKRADRTCIEVWDTGVGIAAHELPKIFDEFYQVGNAGRDRTRGLGMGLSIVKRLVLLLGHELEVRSTPGRGSVFRILLPHSPWADISSVALPADTIPNALQDDRTILFIEDEVAVRQGMQELLAAWGYRVLLAASAEQACQLVRRHAGVIHVVVSDLRLGDGADGISAIAQVRQEYGAPLPALLITGDTSAPEVKRAHDSGHPVLFKPVRSRDLFAALRAAP